jgi:hypothetical protein
MKNALLLAIVSLVSFVVGLTIHTTGQAQKNFNQNKPAATSPAPSPQKDEFPKLIEDKFVTKFNGKRLSLDYDAPFISDDLPSSINAAKLTALRDGGLLVSIGDTLVRFNAQQRAVWRNHLGPEIFDYAYVDSTNLIYATAMDNNMNDGITCWLGAKKLWHLDFPPDAQLVMSGKRILAVTKSKQAIYVNEIEPPRIKSE